MWVLARILRVISLIWLAIVVFAGIVLHVSDDTDLGVAGLAFSLLVLATPALVLLWATRWLRKRPEPTLSTKVEPVTTVLSRQSVSRSVSDQSVIELIGDGTFGQEVVGESNYQAAIEAVAGRKSVRGKKRQCLASLVCENDNRHDENAVAVYVAANKVGYLPKPSAKQYREQLRMLVASLPDARVDALVVGGWKDDDSEGHFGVRLDMIWPIEIEG